MKVQWREERCWGGGGKAGIFSCAYLRGSRLAGDSFNLPGLGIVLELAQLSGCIQGSEVVMTRDYLFKQV